MLGATDQSAGFLSKLLHPLNRARASLQHAQKRYERDFDRRLWRGREKIRTGHYAFIDISNGFTLTPKLENSVEKHHQIFGQNQHPVLIQSEKLVEQIIFAKVLLSLWLTNVPLALPW